MKFLILLALAAVAMAAPDARFLQPLAPPPVILSSGHLQDTYEVQQAKANFFTQYNRALANAPAIPQSSVFNPAQGSFNPSPAFAPIPQTNPTFLSDFAPAGSALTSDIHLADTADVAKAKAIHFRDIARSQGAPTAQYDNYLNTYFGSV